MAKKHPTALRVLFIGNSFTARHNLSAVVKAMAEAGQPGLTFNRTDVIYGGRTLKDHWRLGTQNIVKQATLTEAEEKETIAALEKAAEDDPKDKYAPSALARHRALLPKIEANRQRWDVVVLQSYRDDVEGDPTLYAEYAPKFAELAKAQGARVILYETTPLTQNDKPLTAVPDSAPILAKERAIAAVAKKIAAAVARAIEVCVKDAFGLACGLIAERLELGSSVADPDGADGQATGLTEHAGDEDDAGAAQESAGAKGFAADFTDGGSFDGDGGAGNVIDDFDAATDGDDVAIRLTQCGNAESGSDLGVGGKLTGTAVDGQKCLGRKGLEQPAKLVTIAVTRDGVKRA